MSKNIQIRVKDEGSWVNLFPKTKADLIDGLSTVLASYQETSEKNVANGYAGLDEFGRILISQLPEGATNKTYIVPDIEARNSLESVNHADKSFVLSNNNTYIYNVSVGVINTDGTNVTWVSGDKFDSGWEGESIQIDGTDYVVDTVTDAENLILTASAGDNTGVDYLVSTWLVLAEAEWENVNLAWSNIIDGPQRTPAKIDEAVDYRIVVGETEPTDSNIWFQELT